ncbi:hypothetical protein [Kribbella sp. VKM Ac-2568]|uniref:hypothetical protein n=1 Tax=Kribbella sp. VKM Ac-2568 TaxID=2512219 RepID=UPI0010432795|nr:hypothetical protein [Kribbella sp. VKM Ac-2568]TCM47783.1 hypothetical protein EV648_104176 [Kribbella sp. VKM Ac-2568]
MDWIRRRAGSVLAVSLFALLGWSFVVAASMPSWFDSREDCALTLHRSESYDITVTSQWFPPRAACDFGGGDVVQFISPTKSAILTIALILIAVVVLGSLYLVARRLFEPAGVVRSAEAVDLRARQIRHLITGGTVSFVLIAAFTFANVFALVLGGPLGGLVGALAFALLLSAVAASLDRQIGPLPSTALDSRRRGVAVGFGTFAAIFAATALTGDLPFFRFWAAPVGAIASVALVRMQWRRLARRADGGAGDGDTIEEDLLGGPRS